MPIADDAFFLLNIGEAEKSPIVARLPGRRTSRPELLPERVAGPDAGRHRKGSSDRHDKLIV